MQRLDATFVVAHIEPLDQHETEIIMPVQDKLPETDNDIADAAAELPASQAGRATPTPDPASSTHGYRRWVMALAAIAAAAGIATVMVRNQGGAAPAGDDAGTGQLADGSFEVAEANRMAALREMSS